MERTLHTSLTLRVLLASLVTTSVLVAGPVAAASTTDHAPTDQFPGEERDYCVVIWSGTSGTTAGGEATLPPDDPTRVVCRDRYPNIPEFLEPPREIPIPPIDPIGPVEPVDPIPVEPPRLLG
jgi:hypothetical protein